jgi:hypothetical protein
MPVRPRRRRPTPEQIAQQQNQPGAPFVPGYRTTPPGPGQFGDPGGTSPVAYDPSTGYTIPPNSPPGFIPPGFVPGPTPGTMIIPGTPAMRPPPGGRQGTPGTPASAPIPIPGYQAGQQTPPVGAVPGPDPGTYIIPGTAGTAGDYRGVGRSTGTAAQGPFPFYQGTNVPVGPQLPPGSPQNFGQNIPPFPSPPDPATAAAYHAAYSRFGPTIDPQQMYQYVRPKYKDPLPGGGRVTSEATGRQLATQRIRDSYMQNQLHPWIDQAVVGGLADLTAGLTPAPVHRPAVAAQAPSLFNPLGTPAQPAGTVPGTNPLTAPLLDPGNYPSGGGGGLFPGIPPLGEILGDIGGALIPQFGAPQSPPPPPFPMNSGAVGVPPMGGMTQGVGGQATIRPGPQFP